MPTIDAHDPGTICWIDLASTDAAGATEFYCELFGWTATEPIENAGGYRMLLHDGRQVAGLAPGVGRHRRVGVVDLRRERGRRQTCAAAAENGGEVVMDAMDVLDGRAHGRPARSGRRAGLGLAARRPPGLRGAQRARGADLERADDARPRGRARVLQRRLRLDGAGAGLRRRAATRSGSAASSSSAARSRWTRAGPTTTQPHWMVYIATADCDATARHCRELGGTVWHAAGRHRPRPLRAPARTPPGASFSVITLHAPD